MNIYADRGNIAVLRARCEWRGLGFELRLGHRGRAAGPRRPRPLLHRRRTGPRPGGGGRGHGEGKSEALHAAADRGAAVLAVCGGYQLLGHSYEMGDEELPGHRPGGPAHRARRRPAPDRQLRDRGRPGHRPARDRRASRTTAGAPTSASGAAAARPGALGPRQQRRRRLRGRARGQRDRHLPPRPAAAEERVAGRPADRAGARASSWSRWTTRWRMPRTPRRAARQGSWVRRGWQSGRARDRATRSRPGGDQPRVVAGDHQHLLRSEHHGGVPLAEVVLRHPMGGRVVTIEKARSPRSGSRRCTRSRSSRHRRTRLVAIGRASGIGPGVHSPSRPNAIEGTITTSVSATSSTPRCAVIDEPGGAFDSARGLGHDLDVERVPPLCAPVLGCDEGRHGRERLVHP